MHILPRENPVLLAAENSVPRRPGHSDRTIRVIATTRPVRNNDRYEFAQNKSRADRGSIVPVYVLVE